MSPAGETGTSSTSPHANAPAHGASKMESTPNSREASVISENIGLVGVHVKEVRPWIQRGIEQAEQCKADAMLQVLLQRASCAPETKQPELLQKCLKAVPPVCNGQVSAGGICSSGVETALKKYVRPGVENKFYSPFIEATNIALACLEEIKVDGMGAPVPTVDMICQQNDMPVYQTHQTAISTRKPDFVILPLNSACAPFEDKKGGKKGKQKDDAVDNEKDDEKRETKRKAHMDTNATGKPKNLPWKDVLACIECKRNTPGRTKGINPPPLSYTGRATNVVPVTNKALTKKYGNFQDGMVAKIFLGEANRTSEPEILDKTKEIAKVHPTVQGHMPELLWHHPFTNPTSAIREALGVAEPTKGSRVLYILVFPKLHPITKLHGKELFDVWYQCILCHLTLWKEGVYHRDVSSGNLMWYWKDSKRMGVLNDYDLSSLVNIQGPQGNERTGTVPFMARELLTENGQRGKVKHLYRHDLESFMWVFAWICLRYRHGVLLPRRSRPLDEWATLGAIACGEKKLVFLNNLTPFVPMDIDKLTWGILVSCLLMLKKDADNRYYLRFQGPSDSGADQQPNAEESDPDAFLSKFTCSKSWLALSEPSM